MVSTAPRLHAVQCGVQNPGQERDFTLMQINQTGSGACPPSCSNHLRDFDVKYQLRSRVQHSSNTLEQMGIQVCELVIREVLHNILDEVDTLKTHK
jgi:hypothetical protein